MAKVMHTSRTRSRRGGRANHHQRARRNDDHDEQEEDPNNNPNDSNNLNDSNNEPEDDEEEEEPQAERAQGQGRAQAVSSRVRERQRAIAEREAARLARPEVRPRPRLAHATRHKAAVTSTPSGLVAPPHNSSTSPSSAWCGPFAVARQMMQQQQEREQQDGEQQEHQDEHPLDQVMQELEQARKRKQHPSISWKSKVLLQNQENTEQDDDNDKNQKKHKKAPSLYAVRQRRVTFMPTTTTTGRRIPSLYDLCIQFLVDHFDQVESIGGENWIDASIRQRLAHELVARHALNDAALAALTEPGLTRLELVDASGITTTGLTTCLQSLVPAGLQHLQLSQAGRCFGAQAVQTLMDCHAKLHKDQDNQTNTNTNTNTNHHPPRANGLQRLSIGGAYVLTDAHAADLVKCLAPTLRSLEFQACPLIGTATCQALTCSPTLQLRELALEDLTLSPEAWSTLESMASSSNNSSDGFFASGLECLKLRRMTGLTDEMVQGLLSSCTSHQLTALDVGDNPYLTDATLAAIRGTCAPHLRELNLSHLPELTSVGLQALFTPLQSSDSECPPPPSLQVLDLSQGDSQAVTDSVVQLVVQASCSRSSSSTSSSSTSGGGSRHSRYSYQYYLYDNDSSKTNTWGAANTVLGPGLVYFNVAGSCALTDAALEALVDGGATSGGNAAATGGGACRETLQELNVSFCTHVTNQGLGYLVDHCGRQLHTVHLWGLAQVDELFLDGHGRVQDSTLSIVGAWMKKNSLVAIR